MPLPLTRMMTLNWQIEFLPAEKILYIRTQGVMTFQTADVMVTEIVTAMNHHQCKLQLVDHRKTTFAFHFVEYYERPSVNQKLGVQTSWKIAMVFKRITEETSFMEMVFQNRGFQFQQFDHLENATAWLCKK